ncbi:MAG: tetratricopeptide repeat protein [Gemmataceae bacterium]
MARLPATNITDTPPVPEATASEVPATPAPPQAPGVDTRRAAIVMGRIDLMLAAVVLALAFALASFTVRNSDFWAHLATGRYIASGDTAVLFGHDPYSHATAGRHWANHAWLFDVVNYLLYTADPNGGAVVMFKAILIVLMAGLMLLACRPPAGETIAPGTKANPTGWLAALFGGIGLVAMAPRLLLQPMVMSLPFLAATFWLLTREQFAQRPGRLVAALAGLFALWVNCDAWFILGPMLVLLFLVGEFLQRTFPGANPNPVVPERLKTLAIALGIGLLACLASPHHIYAFVLPADVSGWRLSPALLQDRIYAQQFYRPLSGQYWSTPELGKNLSGCCYAVMLVAGLGAFALNVSYLRWPLVLTWAALAGLSVYIYRAIPLFVVVAVPITVLNLHAWFARRPEWDREAAAPASPPAGGGGITVTPLRLAVFGGLAGRLLTVVVGLLAVAAAYPGWIYQVPNSPRNVAWAVVARTDLKDAAERLQALHESGRMPANPRGLHFYPDFTSYCAWFAPAEKGFFDYRYTLLGDLSADQSRVVGGMREWARGEDETEWMAVLRKRGITHVVLVNADDVVSRCFYEDRQWALWFQNGTTAALGWHDPEQPASPDPAREDLVKEAFGVSNERLPAPKVLPAPSAEAEQGRDFLERYLAPPKSPAPYELQASLIDMRLHEVAVQRARERAANTWNVTEKASLIGQVAVPGEQFTWAFLRQDRARLAIIPMAGRNSESHALVILAVREAQRAVAAAPGLAVTWLRFAAFLDPGSFPEIGSEVRELQLLAAFRQGVARATPEDRSNRGIASSLTAAYIKLYDAHIRQGQLDLAVEALAAAMKQFPYAPPFTIPEDQVEGAQKFYEDRLAKLNDGLAKLREQFDLQSARQPPLGQAQMALQAGLYLEAQKILEANADKLDPVGKYLLTSIYLSKGEVAEANIVLDSVPALEDPQLRNLARSIQDQRIRAAIEGADLARAAKELDESFAGLQEDMSDPISNWALGMTVGEVILGDLGTPAGPFVRAGLLIDARAGHRHLYRLERLVLQMADRHAWRGILALQEGDATAALRHLLEATQPARGPAVNFAGRGNALGYIEILKKQNPDVYQQILKERAAGH